MTPPSAAQDPGAWSVSALDEDDRLCLSCNGCRVDCAVGAATGRLQPLRIVRMASLGLGDELMRLPELWYCLQCNRCSLLCPMTVKPSEVVRRARQQALLRGVVTGELVHAHEGLVAGFARARWHAIARCMAAQDASDIARDWRQWSKSPVASMTSGPIADGATAAAGALRRAAVSFVPRAAELCACMTCRQCTLGCPMAREQSGYDPLAIFRMVHLGLTHELLRSPSIWLCLGCESCSSGCAQKVSGHLVIRALQDEASRQGIVPADMRDRLWAADRALYAQLVREVDELMKGTFSGR